MILTITLLILTQLFRKARLEEDIVNLKNYYLGLMTNVAQFELNQLDRKLISKIRIGLFGPTGISSPPSHVSLVLMNLLQMLVKAALSTRVRELWTAKVVVLAIFRAVYVILNMHFLILTLF